MQLTVADVMKWNICRSRGWAELVVDAHNSGRVYSDSNFPSEAIDIKTPEDLRLYFCEAKFSGPYAWITPKGQAMPVSIGAHDIVATLILGDSVEEVEQRCARISYHTKNLWHPLKHVKKEYQTQAMLEAVVSWMLDHPNQYPDPTKESNEY